MLNELQTIGVETREGYEKLKALVAERDRYRQGFDEVSRAHQATLARVEELEAECAEQVKRAEVAMAREAEALNSRDSWRARCGELEAWQLAIAEGTGFINHAEGQAGYEVADPETILNHFKRS